MRWGMSINPATHRPYIENEVIEFLMDREAYLNNITTSDADIKSSPRSWEYVSDTYRTYKEATNLNFTTDDLLNAISGDVGCNIAVDFVTFLEDNKNALIKPAYIFEGESYTNKALTPSVKNIILNESMLRKNVLVRNCLRYIRSAYMTETNNGSTKKLSKEYKIKEQLFIELLTSAISNNDLMYSILFDLSVSKAEEDQKYLKHLLDLKDINILNAYTKLTQTI
jgi:hypothetical protein